MTLYLDLDGVLADFDRHVRELFGVPPSKLRLPELWGRAAHTPGFFETMPLMPDAMELWEYCEPFGPIILTGLPRGRWAAGQKRRWVARHLGPDVPVVTCLSREKCLHAAPGDVLVDDTTKYAGDWEARGGIFVHHRSAAGSIEQLRLLGYEHERPDRGKAVRDPGQGPPGDPRPASD